MVRIYETLAGRVPLVGIRIVYTNIAQATVGGAVTEGDGPTNLTIISSLEVHPTITNGTWAVNGGGNFPPIPVYFGGQRQVTIPPGGVVTSDPVYFPFGAGRSIYIRTYHSADGSFVTPTSRTLNSAVLEYTNNGFFASAVPFSGSSAVTTMTGSLSGLSGVNLPLVAGGVAVFGGSITGVIYDNGSGGFATGNGIAAGSTINYTTGAITLNLTVAAVPTAIHSQGYGIAGSNPPDETLTTTTLSDLNNIAQFVYAHSDVIGIIAAPSPIPPLGILLVGDSLLYGSGNTDNGMSWADYALGGMTGRCKIAQISETAALFVQSQYNQRRLRQAYGRFDRIIEGYGTNDINIGQTLAQIQANKLAIWSFLAALCPNGFRGIYAPSVLPRTVSPSNQAPLVAAFGPGTVASGSPSIRNAYNAWLFTQVGVTIGGVIDISAAVENAPASQAGSGDGTWKFSTDTSDGTHCTLQGYQKISAMFGYGGTNPNPAFAP
jgi:hypothetical protein